MGDGALKIMDMLNRRGIELCGIYASDEYVRGHSFCGYKVQKLSEVVKRHGASFITLLAFATEREPLLSHLYSLAEEMPFYAPDVEVADYSGEPFDIAYLNKNRTALEFLYDRLGDDLSRRTLEGVIDFKLSGKPCYLKKITTEKVEIFKNLIRPSKEEFFLDVGAFRGDTMESFLKEAGGASRLFGLEPDAKNFKKLFAYCEALRQSGINASCLNAAGWDKNELLDIKGGNGGRNGSVSSGAAGAGNESRKVEAVSLDTLFLEGTEPVTFIKLDAEGAEKKVLQGAAGIIKKWKPVLMVSAYHRNEDLIELPRCVLSIRADYEIYLRHHPYLPAWETCLYFV